MLGAYESKDKIEHGSDDAELEYVLNNTIKAVTNDYGIFSFNTAVARMMELVNAMSRLADKGSVSGAALFAAAKSLIKLLAPLAPHIAEELWENIGERYSVFNAPFPVCDESKLKRQTVELASSDKQQNKRQNYRKRRRFQRGNRKNGFVKPGNQVSAGGQKRKKSNNRPGQACQSYSLTALNRRIRHKIKL